MFSLIEIRCRYIVCHEIIGAISLATLTARLSKERREALLELMRKELRELGLRE